MTRVRDTTWQDEVHQWACDTSGEVLTPLEHVRTEAWSTVWRAQGTEATFWFKENTPSLTPEGPVQAVLAGLAPDQVAPPVAWDADKGWLLTLDGGQVLQDRYPEHRGMDREAIGDMLRSYVLLQRATIGQAERLAAAGLPDRSPAPQWSPAEWCTWPQRWPPPLPAIHDTSLAKSLRDWNAA